MRHASAESGSNRLLNALPDTARRGLARALATASIETHEVLYEPGQPIDYVYFPGRGCLISLFLEMGDGRAFRAALVGDEGMVGAEVLLGDGTAHYTARVLAGGSVLRMKADALRAKVRNGSPLSIVLRRYVQCLLRHFAQVAGCNRFHSLEQHFATVLLVMQFLSGREDLHITHELFARIIGVRRVGITLVARELQRAGLIRYSWGKVAILDRTGLESRACVCHRQIEQGCRRMFGSNGTLPNFGQKPGHRGN